MSRPFLLSRTILWTRDWWSITELTLCKSSRKRPRLRCGRSRRSSPSSVTPTNWWGRFLGRHGQFSWCRHGPTSVQG